MAHHVRQENPGAEVGKSLDMEKIAADQAIGPVRMVETQTVAGGVSSRRKGRIVSGQQSLLQLPGEAKIGLHLLVLEGDLLPLLLEQANAFPVKPVLQFHQGLRGNQPKKLPAGAEQHNIIVKIRRFPREDQFEGQLYVTACNDADRMGTQIIPDWSMGEERKSVLRSQEHADVRPGAQAQKACSFLNRHEFMGMLGKFMEDGAQGQLSLHGTGMIDKVAEREVHEGWAGAFASLKETWALLAGCNSTEGPYSL